MQIWCKWVAIQIGLSAATRLTRLRCTVNGTSAGAPGGSEVSSDSIQASHRLVTAEQCASRPCMLSKTKGEQKEALVPLSISVSDCKM